MVDGGSHHSSESSYESDESSLSCGGYRDLSFIEVRAALLSALQLAKAVQHCDVYLGSFGTVNVNTPVTLWHEGDVVVCFTGSKRHVFPNCSEAVGFVEHLRPVKRIALVDTRSDTTFTLHVTGPQYLVEFVRRRIAGRRIARWLQRELRERRLLTSSWDVPDSFLGF